jgi:hypothetical protein
MSGPMGLPPRVTDPAGVFRGSSLSWKGILHFLKDENSYK